MRIVYMFSIFDSIVLGAVQGITEFLPISSSGHLIIAREFLGISQEGSLAYDAMLQLATALAVLIYFRKDVFDLCINIFKKEKDTEKTKLTVFLIIATIPAIVFGLLLQEHMETIFRSASLVIGTLIVGAGIMFVADKVLARRIKNKALDSRLRGNDDAEGLTIKKSIIIGLFQCLALVPGMSRSGMTISGGYIMGLSKDFAVRFSFLMAIPIIVGSGLVKLLDIIKNPEAFITSNSVLVAGFISSFVFGWLAIDFLLKFLKTNSFTVFVVYRVLLAGVLLLLFI